LIERKVDTLCAIGDTTLGITGFANDANIPAITKGTQGTGTNWTTATADEIIKDVTSLFSGVITNSETVHEPNMLLVGKNGWSILRTKRLDTFNMTTVYQYLVNTLGLRIEKWP